MTPNPTHSQCPTLPPPSPSTVPHPPPPCLDHELSCQVRGWLGDKGSELRTARVFMAYTQSGMWQTWQSTMTTCVCACVRACMHACVCVCPHPPVVKGVCPQITHTHTHTHTPPPPLYTLSIEDVGQDPGHNVITLWQSKSGK